MHHSNPKNDNVHNWVDNEKAPTMRPHVEALILYPVWTGWHPRSVQT